MKTFKKIIAFTLAAAMVAAVSVGATVAYLQDTDSDVNVMTLGNVQIAQIEKEWNEDNTKLVDFTQAKPLYPYVGTFGWEIPTSVTRAAGTFNDAYRRFTMENVVDKYVTVKNTGKSDAYVRTFIALEMGEYADLTSFAESGIGISNNAANGDEFDFPGTWLWTDDFMTTIGEKNYNVMVAVHENPLKPGEETIPSLLQVYLSKDAGNEEVEKLDGNGNGTYDILVFSEGVQTAGFENSAVTTFDLRSTAFDAQIALNTAFGDPSVGYHPWTNDAPEFPVLVGSGGPQELKDAMLIRGANIVLTEDIVVDKETPLQWGAYMFVANGREVTINLNGHDIIVEADALIKTNALFTTANGGTLNIVGEGTVEVKNGKSGIFHAMNKNDQINVYGGTYISNSDNGGDALAIIYTNSGNVDVYGGKFVSPAGIEVANAEDRQGNRLSIVFHEGTVLKHNKYYAGYDATRIQLEEGCELVEVVIDGKVWYQVAKEGTEADSSVLKTADAVYDSTLKSGTVYLNANIKTSDSAGHYNGNREYAITGGREYTLNLNGHTITHDGTYQDGKNTGYTYLFTVAHANSKLTINGEGTINSANSEGLVSIVYAQSGTETVINGGDFRPTKGVAVWAGNGSKITINGGSFISTGAGEELIYSSGGVIDIYGGFFHNTDWDNRPVNVANANRATGFINIYGGTFVNFDPSTGGDDPNNIKVMDGYKVVSETQANGDVWYTVVAE